MKDIYIQRSENRTGCRRILLVALVLCFLIGLGAFFWRTRRNKKAEDYVVVEEHAGLESIEEMPVYDAEPDVIEEVVQTAENPEPEIVSANVTGNIAEALRLIDEQRLSEAREKCLEVLSRTDDPSIRRQAEDILSSISTDIVFSPRVMQEKVEYTIQPGDTLGKLAQKFGTTVDLIAKGNNVKGIIIRVGDRFRILNGDFSIRIDKSDCELVLYLNGSFFKRYRVGTGKYERTPTGQFKITDRIAQPTWWRPDGKAVPFGSTNNVLGTHWLSLDLRGYGIHGTWEPDTIGKQASAGCVRLLNEDIEELYTLIPIGVPVEIVD